MITKWTSSTLWQQQSFIHYVIQLVIICLFLFSQVHVFGFGADKDGNWNHYWEELRDRGLKTGIHPGNHEYGIIQELAEQQKVKFYRGWWPFSQCLMYSGLRSRSFTKQNKMKKAGSLVAFIDLSYTKTVSGKSPMIYGEGKYRTEKNVRLRLFKLFTLIQWDELWSPEEVPRKCRATCRINGLLIVPLWYWRTLLICSAQHKWSSVLNDAHTHIRTKNVFLVI